VRQIGQFAEASVWREQQGEEPARLQASWEQHRGGFYLGREVVRTDGLENRSGVRVGERWVWFAECEFQLACLLCSGKHHVLKKV
jgi:hypothetical protein